MLLNKDIEEKSIYQFDEGGDIVACVDCEKKHLNSQKPNKIVIWSESRWCSGIYVHIFIRLDYWSSNRIGRKINRKIKGECRLHKLVMMDGEFENYSLDEAQQKMNDMFQVVKMMNGKGCTIKFEFYDYKDKKPDDLFLEGDEE